jgi:glycosyltransferase involved in cell wall biosynthesis
VKVGIIIPAHNEENYIKKTLDSLVNQTYLPNLLCVVNDNSTDNTSKIITHYTDQFEWIYTTEIKSSESRIPGEKVINAWNKGLTYLTHCDIVCKFDADLIFPENYISELVKRFSEDEHLGIFGGVLQILDKKQRWVDEKISNLNHVRGPIKAYNKKCLYEMGGLKTALGWDTVDILLAQFHGWKTITDVHLKVKHLRPTGSDYSPQNIVKAFYAMRYGYFISMIASLKQKRYKFKEIGRLHRAYQYAKLNQTTFLVSKEEGRFIRKIRWKGIWSKFWYSFPLFISRIFRKFC